MKLVETILNHINYNISLLRKFIIGRKYTYKVINAYYEKNKNIYLAPTGEFLPFGGDIEIDSVFTVTLPTTAEILEKNIFDCFAFCWTKIEKEIGPSTIEKHLNIKSYKKIVEQFDFIRINFDKKTKQYELWYDFKKEKNSYSNCKTFNFGKKIDFEYLLNIIQDDISRGGEYGKR